MQKVERLVNLIALLLNTRRPLTVDDIRHTVPGYQQEDYASFKRMFERDKEELRTLGIPIERRFTDVWEIEEGYLIPPERYYLPDLDLTPDEVAALWVVSRVIVEPGAKEDQALLKLALGTGVDTDPVTPPWLRARVHMDQPSLPTLLEAVAARRRVRFRYKPATRSRENDRRVDPYALIHRQGAWYLVGFDHLRSDVRHFKLQRITSAVAFTSRGLGPEFEVPEEFSLEGHLVSEPWAGEEGTAVEVAFSPRIAWWTEQSLGLQAVGSWRDWTVVRLNVVDVEGLLSWVLSFGEDAVVRAPTKVRTAMVERLRRIVEAPRPSGPARRRAPKSDSGKQHRRRRGDDARTLGRLERILLLVPYCLRRNGVSVEELTTRFGVTRREILEDLDLVFMCGLPDYTPADLIDVVVEGDHVSIRMADYFARPLRLTRTEAIPLYVKAQALLDLLQTHGGQPDGVADELAPLRAGLTKLGQALLPQDGSVADLTERIRVHLEAGEAKWLPLLREAVTQRKRLDLEYYTYSRDTITQRQVDPLLVFASMGHWYVSGYCHLAQDKRMFRLDRIKSLMVTGETFEPPEDGEDLPPPILYVPGPEDATVRLRTSARAGPWLSEYLPVDEAAPLRGGGFELTFRTSAFPWLEKLLLRFGSDVEVLEPPELADRVRDAARQILALYQPSRAKASK